MIYLASPYSHSNRYIRELRYQAIAHVLGYYLDKKKLAYAPVVHGHATEKELGREINYKTWVDHGLKMLFKCSEMHIIPLPGWAISNGILLEKEYALNSFIPVRELKPKNVAEMMPEFLWNRLNKYQEDPSAAAIY